MKKDDIISAEDIAVKTGTDAESIYFVKGLLSDNDSVTVDSSQSKSAYFKYGGINTILSAKVMCKQTAESLDAALTALGSKYDFSASSAVSYCSDAQPCCVVILQKRQ